MNNLETDQARKDLTETLAASFKQSANPLMGSPFASFDVNDLVAAIEDFVEAKFNELNASGDSK